jgi:hypothetical protein
MVLLMGFGMTKRNRGKKKRIYNPRLFSPDHKSLTKWLKYFYSVALSQRSRLKANTLVTLPELSLVNLRGKASFLFRKSTSLIGAKLNSRLSHNCFKVRPVAVA